MYENIKSHFILKLWFATLLSLFGLLPTMTLFRLFTYWTYGQNVPFSFQLIEAFWMGIRFDLVVLFYGLAPTSVIFMLLYLTGLKISDQILKLFSTIYLTIFGLFCSIVLAADMKYYSYFQDHINILFFGLFNDDTSALIATFWKNYPVLLYAFLFSATAVLLFLYFKKSISYFIEFATSKPEANPKNESKPVGHSLLQRIPIVIAIFGFIFIGGRGSFDLFPLGPADTVISNNSFINYLTSNGIHALYRAIKLKKKQNASWDSNLKFYSYTSPNEAIKDYLGTRDFLLNNEKISTNPSEDALFKTLSKSLQHKTAKNKWASETRPHVVVIVMESFGTYWLKYQSSTFDLLGSFQEHTQKDLFLTNFLPSSDSTTGSLSSLMISSPHRPIGNFLTESEYLQVPFQTSPAKVYKNHGYKTRFIYGGNPGWRDMNKFAKYQGFDTIEGDVDIESKLGPLSEKHDWGVYDEDLFKYIEVTLKEAQEPQMR